MSTATAGHAPFRVEQDGWGWALIMRPSRYIKCFKTQAEAIDYAYRNWPWWL